MRLSWYLVLFLKLVSFGRWLRDSRFGFHGTSPDAGESSEEDSETGVRTKPAWVFYWGDHRYDHHDEGCGCSGTKPDHTRRTGNDNSADFTNHFLQGFIWGLYVGSIISFITWLIVWKVCHRNFCHSSSFFSPLFRSKQSLKRFSDAGVTINVVPHFSEAKTFSATSAIPCKLNLKIVFVFWIILSVSLKVNTYWTL